jgi:signal transduction histidine kinase
VLPAVGALVFLSIAEDPRPQPWLGWVGGLAGSTLSLWFHGDGTAAPFLATFIGGGAGLLLRSRTMLVGEAVELRGQAAWLEQRTSVARELHDVVGHHVTAMVVQAEAGQVADPQVALRTIGELGRTALAELDSLVVHLRDPGARLAVTAPPRLLDIDELLAAPLRQAGVEVDVHVDEGLGMDEVTVLTVYRIAQEALTNVVRHAQARHVWVELASSDGGVRLRVSDDGVGPPTQRTRGSGLLGIEERVAGSGGTWDLAPRPGGGSILDVRLPG